MRFCLDVFSIHGSLGIKKYVNACQQYLLLGDLSTRDFFPPIRLECPVCTRPGCAIWKGYYKRTLVCILFDGVITILCRKGWCKTTKTHFSYLPDFVIPRMKWSIPLLIQMIEDYLKSYSINQVIPSHEMAISTLYWILQFLISHFRIHATHCNLPPLACNSIHELKKIKTSFDWKSILIQIFHSSNFNSSGRSPPPCNI